MWVALPSLRLKPRGSYTPLELPSFSGVLHVLILASPLDENPARYEVGVFAGSQSNPQLVGIQQAAIAPFDRHLRFEFPPDLSDPLLGLRVLGQREGIYPLQLQVNVSSCGETMAFYDNTLTQLSDRVDGELAKRLETVATIPNPNDFEDGHQFIYSETGEVVTLKGNYWIGEIQEESFSVVANAKVDMVAGDSRDFSPAVFYDFDGGPKRYYEHLVLSNAESQNRDFDIAVPGFGDQARTNRIGMTPKQALTVDLSLFSNDVQSPDIHVLTGGDKKSRASLTLSYRNAFEYIDPNPEPVGFSEE